MPNDFPEEYSDGYVLFCGQRFSVDPRALIPRFETEELVKYCVKLLREHPEINTVADIGTGSGIIPISVAHKTERPLKIFATDLSQDALDLARENCEKLAVSVIPESRNASKAAGEMSGIQVNKLSQSESIKISEMDSTSRPPTSDLAGMTDSKMDDSITFLQGSLLEPLIQHFGKNPPENILITANLPYVREVEVDHTLIHEPRMAFVGGGRSGFDLYEAFFKQLNSWKNRPKNCHVVIEFGLWQRDIAETVIVSYGWEYEFFADLRGIERFAYISLR